MMIKHLLVSDNSKWEMHLTDIDLFKLYYRFHLNTF
jgi:hypothetical protein